MAGLLPDDCVEWRLRPASGPGVGARTTVSCGLGSDRRLFKFVAGKQPLEFRFR